MDRIAGAAGNCESNKNIHIDNTPESPIVALSIIVPCVGRVTHRPRTTDLVVDSVWMPRYESNQRSKNNNKSL